MGTRKLKIKKKKSYFLVRTAASLATWQAAIQAQTHRTQHSIKCDFFLREL